LESSVSDFQIREARIQYIKKGHVSFLVHAYAYTTFLESYVIQVSDFIMPNCPPVYYFIDTRLDSKNENHEMVLTVMDAWELRSSLEQMLLKLIEAFVAVDLGRWALVSRVWMDLIIHSSTLHN
jgi:hypothetical protein